MIGRTINSTLIEQANKKKGKKLKLFESFELIASCMRLRTKFIYSNNNDYDSRHARALNNREEQKKIY